VALGEVPGVHAPAGGPAGHEAAVVDRQRRDPAQRLRRPVQRAREHEQRRRGQDRRGEARDHRAHLRVVAGDQPVGAQMQRADK
jgi:hypothetical protein